MIDFSTVKALTIPEGVVKQIACNGAILWKNSTKPLFKSYTGEYTESAVTISGVPHTLYTLTTSGTLSIEGEGIRYFICGGGAGGKTAHPTPDQYSDWSSGNGGGGGYVRQGLINKPGDWAVIIGAGGASNADGNPTSIVDYTTVNGGSVDGSGGSGGGGNGSVDDVSPSYFDVCPGEGRNTLPFNLTTLKEHSAGGGGGGARYKGSTSSGTVQGGAGGSGGSDGSKAVRYGGTSVTPGGTGGTQGGGNGGSAHGTTASQRNGKNATFYGSGGGGGGAYITADDVPYYGNGGTGYQGVVYIAVPVVA